MLGLVAAFLFAGYTLVYAAVANGGKFAATPWEGLRRSAYDDENTGAGGGSSSSGLLGKVGSWLPILQNPTQIIAKGLGLP